VIVRINGYPIDVAMSEEHSFPGEVTKRPVEQGVEFTDHIRDLPPVIKIEGIVSNLPTGEIASDATRTGVPLPSAEAIAKLRELKAARKPVTIETSLGRYESMAFVELVVPRDAARSEALFFSATFERIEVVANKRTRVRTTMAGRATARSRVATTMVVTSQFEWRHGVPPGKAWKAPNPIEIVRIENGAPGVTKAEVMWIALQGTRSRGVKYYDATGAEIVGARRDALISDLRRDASQQVKNGEELLAGLKKKTQQAAKPDPWGKPGTSTKRFILKDPPKDRLGDFLPESVVAGARRAGG
jgi:hypothetical protein